MKKTKISQPISEAAPIILLFGGENWQWFGPSRTHLADAFTAYAEKHDSSRKALALSSLKISQLMNSKDPAAPCHYICTDVQSPASARLIAEWAAKDTQNVFIIAAAPSPRECDDFEDAGCTIIRLSFSCIGTRRYLLREVLNGLFEQPVLSDVVEESTQKTA